MFTKINLDLKIETKQTDILKEYIYLKNGILVWKLTLKKCACGIKRIGRMYTFKTEHFYTINIYVY